MRGLVVLIMLLVAFLPPLHAAEVVIAAVPFQSSQPCTGTFVEHPLPFTTTTSRRPIRFYESNGAGLAVNDLDDDGLLDLVMSNLHGRNTILWNDGNLRFTPQPLADGRSRAAGVVDVDGDNLLDILFTHSTSSLSYWRNEGITAAKRASFSMQPLRGVRRPAYVLTWADVNRDGLLDLITASYDSELGRELGNTFLFSDGAGVFYYQQSLDGSFTPTRLAEQSQALAIWISDLNHDGLLDLFIGNDFTFPDQYWSFTAGAWHPVEFFSQTTLSTMSFDAADIDNDGSTEFFAADMQPYSDDPTIRAIWQPVLDQLANSPRLPGDLQIIRNLLQQSEPTGYRDRAQDYGIAATGWSWSSKFGDLNNDGWLDLYVVNGMIAADLFRQLPDAALVETNLAFMNQQGERFLPMPEWNLGSLASGRGMSMADLDSDGDLDIIINNLAAPAQLYENQLCGGHALQVDLRWPTSPNTRAIGAVLTLHTPQITYTRDVRAMSGYLSGDPSRIHFGFPAETPLQKLTVRWPDGLISTIEQPAAQNRLTITRSN